MTRRTFVGKVMSLLFNMLSRFVIAFLPRRKAAVTICSDFKSPLDCKEIELVNPKGKQSWIFIGRNDAEAETPILWPPDVKNWLIGEDPDAGKDWRQEKVTTEDEMVGWHHRLNGHEFEQALGVGDGQEAWHFAVHGVTKSHTPLNDWTELNWLRCRWCGSGFWNGRMLRLAHILSVSFLFPGSLFAYGSKDD